MNTLEDKVILVTGAASGLGAAISQQLVQARARVVLADLDADKAAQVAHKIDPQGHRTLALSCDVGLAGAAERAMGAIRRQWGGLDVLINNAGTDHTAPVQDIAPEQWTRVVHTNLFGPFLLVKAGLAMLREADQGRGGQIVNIASTASLRAWPNASAYHASKWGLRGLSEALHAEFRSSGIRVSTVIAGGMRTPFLLDRFPDIDLNVLQPPQNVASAILFLLGMPRGSVVAEIMVLPQQETSWP